MLYRLTYSDSSYHYRKYAWGEEKCNFVYNEMLAENYGLDNITIEVYSNKQWRVIKGRTKCGRW